MASCASWDIDLTETIKKIFQNNNCHVYIKTYEPIIINNCDVIICANPPQVTDELIELEKQLVNELPDFQFHFIHNADKRFIPFDFEHIE